MQYNHISPVSGSGSVFSHQQDPDPDPSNIDPDPQHCLSAISFTKYIPLGGKIFPLPHPLCTPMILHVQCTYIHCKVYDHTLKSTILKNNKLQLKKIYHFHEGEKILLMPQLMFRIVTDLGNKTYMR